MWYSFEVGNVHYVVTPFQVGGDYKSCYSKNDRWRWLENDLANTDENMKVVMFNHTVPSSDDYVISFDRKELDLKKHNLIAWCYGHYHYNYVKENNGVLNISTARPDCGGIDSSVSGARMVYIAKDGSVSTKMTYYDFDVNDNLIQPENTAWSAKLNGNILYCNTVIQNGKVYVATVDDDYPRNCGVYCLDENNGSVLWYYETVNSVKNNLIVENGLVVAQDCQGNVYCINLENGSLKLKTTVKLGSSLNTSTGIVLDNGIVYAGCAAAITAIDINSGEKVWENIRNHGEASPAEFVITGDKLIVSSHWDALVASNKNTGKQIGKIKDDDIRFRSSTPCVVDEKTLLVADSDAIMLVNSDEGKITSKFDFEDYNFSSSGQPVISGDLAYIPTANKGIVIFDLNTQKIVNEIAVEKALIYTAPYTSGNSLTVEPTITVNDKGQMVFASSDGNLYVLSENGEIQDKVFIGAPVFSSVACNGSNVAVGDFAGRVIYLNQV